MFVIVQLGLSPLLLSVNYYISGLTKDLWNDDTLLLAYLQ
jgi:hypothetical protein